MAGIIELRASRQNVVLLIDVENEFKQIPQSVLAEEKLEMLLRGSANAAANWLDEHTSPLFMKELLKAVQELHGVSSNVPKGATEQ